MSRNAILLFVVVFAALAIFGRKPQVEIGEVVMLGPDDFPQP